LAAEPARRLPCMLLRSVPEGAPVVTFLGRATLMYGKHGSARKQSSESNATSQFTNKESHMKPSMFTTAVAVVVFLLPGTGLPAQSVTDAQIASIVVTANQVDIDAGKLAEARATRDEVKAFARLMATDHTGVNKSATALAAKLELTPENNAAALFGVDVDAVIADSERWSDAGRQRAFSVRCVRE
jgi:hypothetical protein